MEFIVKSKGRIFHWTYCNATTHVKIMKKPKLNSFELYEDSPISGERKVCKLKREKGKRNSPSILFTASLKLLVKYYYIYNIKPNCLLTCSSPLVKPLLLSSIHAHVKKKLASSVSSSNFSIFIPFNDSKFAICGSPSTSSSLSLVLGLTSAPTMLILNNHELLSETVCKLQHTHVAW